MEEKLNRTEGTTLILLFLIMPLLIAFVYVCGYISNTKVALWIILLYTGCGIWMSSLYVEKEEKTWRKLLMFLALETIPFICYGIGIFTNIVLF